jgi:uroporphyrinogen decarboxylase
MPAHQPDRRRLLNVLTGQAPPDRLPFIDLRVDDDVIERIAGEPFREGATSSETEAITADLIVRCCLELDWDMVWARCSVPFRKEARLADDTAGSGARAWQDSHGGGMATREEFEAYPWPQPGAIQEAHVEALANRVPEGMGIFSTTSGVYENVTRLTGVESFAYLLMDDPDLVGDLFQAVGERIVAHIDKLASLDAIDCCWMGDDLGHKTGLQLSPAMLREYVFPWIRRAAEACHRYSKPFVLHSCGRIYSVMDEIIALGIDAKHSFEDGILPVEDAVQRYSDRLGLVGGVDVHLLAQGDLGEIRKRTREIIEACAPSGRWALGSGNSFANYIPVEAYQAMLDVGRETWGS